MPSTASTSRTGARSTPACGNIGIANRRKPYVPILRSTPASTTETAVGAWACAAGSKVWNGMKGISTPKPIANANNNHLAVPDDNAGDDCAHVVRAGTLNV